MMAVSLFPNGEFNKMEPFADQIQVNNLIDMEVGPDGRVYLLEYGSGWFSKNDDSALSYIEYNGGNRPPVIESFIVDKTTGKLPLTITAKVEARDREDDAMTYVWDLGMAKPRKPLHRKLHIPMKMQGIIMFPPLLWITRRLRPKVKFLTLWPEIRDRKCL